MTSRGTEPQMRGAATSHRVALFATTRLGAGLSRSMARRSIPVARTWLQEKRIVRTKTTATTRAPKDRNAQPVRRSWPARRTRGRFAVPHVVVGYGAGVGELDGPGRVTMIMDVLKVGGVLLIALVGAVLLVWLLTMVPTLRRVLRQDQTGVVVAAIVAVVGWYAAHVFSSQRDAENRRAELERDAHNKRREVRVQNLIDAYRKIESICAREERITRKSEYKEQIDKVETAFADVQLFGDERQRDLVKAIIREIETTQSSDPRKLLVVLRNDMRRDLDLPLAPDDPKDIIHFRVWAEPGNAPKNAPGAPR